MSKRLLMILIVGFCLPLGAGGSLTAAEAPAEPHAEAAAEQAELPPLLNLDLGSAVWNLLIFLLTFAILAFFVWPPILKGLQSRESKIHTDLKQAEQANVDAQRLLEDYQKKLDEAQAQVQAMLADARQDAEAAGERIVDDAKAEAGRQRERAVADIENAKKVAIGELADQTSEMAMRLAQQVVGRELKPEDHAQLIRESLERMPSRN